MGSSFVTDMVWHQILPFILSHRTFSSVLNVRPTPFLSTAFACGWGIPVGLYKLGYFQQSLNVQKLALQLAGNDPMLAREIGKLLKAAFPFPLYEASTEVGKAMLDFIAEHEASLPAELSTLARAIKDENVAALATVEGLVKCGRAYAESDEGYEFTECSRPL